MATKKPTKAPAKKAVPVKKAPAPKAVKKPVVKKEASVMMKKAERKDTTKEVPHKEGHKELGFSGIRIRLSAFDHRVLDEAGGKIIDTAQRSGAVVHGPVPLPTHIRKFTVNKSTFVHKNARDQYEMRIHRRLIDLSETTFKTMESLQGLSLPSGVDIEIKMQ